MSLVVERFLMCDDCGETFGVDNRSFSTRMQRQSSKENGWHTNGTHDYCPECYKKRKEESK